MPRPRPGLSQWLPTVTHGFPKASAGLRGIHEVVVYRVWGVSVVFMCTFLKKKIKKTVHGWEEIMGKSIFRASSLTPPPTPMSRLWGFRGGFLLLPRAAGCARVRANNEMGGKGGATPEKVVSRYFLPSMDSEKNELVHYSWARLHSGCAHNGCFCVTCDDRFWCPSRSTAGACLTQLVGTERCPRLGQRPPVHPAVSFLECQYLCR